MSGPVPSPRINGMIGLSGTVRRPWVMVIFSPGGGVTSLKGMEVLFYLDLGGIWSAKILASVSVIFESRFVSHRATASLNSALLLRTTRRLCSKTTGMEMSVLLSWRSACGDDLLKAS